MPGGRWPPLRVGRCRNGGPMAAVGGIIVPYGRTASERRGVEDAAPYGGYGIGTDFVILSAAKDPYPPRSVDAICLRQIAFVPNAGRPVAAPTAVR